MRKRFTVLGTLMLVLSGIACAQSNGPAAEAQKPAAQVAGATAGPAYVIPAEFAKKPNPIRPTVKSIAEGKRIYGYDCAMCHGDNGDGKGDLAGDMKLTLKDFRDPSSLKETTDGDMFYIIEKGKGQMPGEGNRETPEELWNIINFVRSLAKKNPKPAGK
jgi:mono/diheme cytochrome c family protein